MTLNQEVVGLSLTTWDEITVEKKLLFKKKYTHKSFINYSTCNIFCSSFLKFPILAHTFRVELFPDAETEFLNKYNVVLHPHLIPNTVEIFCNDFKYNL